MLLNRLTKILKGILQFTTVVFITLSILLTGCSKGNTEIENIPITSEEEKNKTDAQAMENLNLQEAPINKKEALDILFTYLYEDGDDLNNLVFVDEEEIAYRWDTLVNSYIYLQEDGYSEDGQYIAFMLWESVYSPEDGTQYLWHWLNTFAVNLHTGEILECMEYDEYGVKYYGYDYYKYILQEEVDTTGIIKGFDYSLLFKINADIKKIESSKNANIGIEKNPVINIFSKNAFSYVHKEYEWKMLKENDNLQAYEELEEYLEALRTIIADDKYLEITSLVGYKEFVGDEKLIEVEKKIGNRNSEYYSVDMFNCGERVIFERTVNWPVVKSGEMFLEPIFYLYDIEKQERMEVYRLDNSNKSKSRCVQLWFKELDGYVYTFIILQVDEEQYLFNVYAIDKYCGLEYDVNLVHQEMIRSVYK